MPNSSIWPRSRRSTSADDEDGPRMTPSRTSVRVLTSLVLLEPGEEHDQQAPGRDRGHCDCRRREGRAGLRALGWACALSACQWMRRTERARHHRRGHLVLARAAQARDDGLPRRRPAAGSPHGRHRRGVGRRCGRVDAACRGARLRRRAGAAAVLLQGRAGRRARGLCRDDRAGDGRQARSRFISITSPRNPACRGMSSWSSACRTPSARGSSA